MATGTIGELRSRFTLNGTELNELQFYNFISYLVVLGIAREIGFEAKETKRPGRPAKIMEVPEEIVLRLTPKQ